MSDKDPLVLPDSLRIQNEQEENVPSSFHLEVVVNSSNSSQEPENNQSDRTDDVASNQVSEPGQKLNLFCVECKTAYKTVISFEVHKQWHRVLRPYKCVKCEAMFQRSDALQAHLRWHGRPFVCGICKMTFRSAWSCKLKIHMRKHTSRRPWKCWECKALFVERTSLDVHKEDVHPELFSLSSD